MTRNKYSLIISIFILAQVLLSCAQKSVFKIEPDQNEKYVFQFCGGQQWGYLKPLSPKEKAPYLGVYLVNEIFEDRIQIAPYFVIQAQEDTEIVFKTRVLKIIENGVTISSQPTNFRIIPSEKQIWELYPRTKYTSKQVATDEWEIRKMKYGGMFGEMALEEPFIIKTNTHKIEETNSNIIKLNLDENLSDIYVVSSSFAFPRKRQGSKPLTITVRTPEFQVNGTIVKETDYVFHVDQSRLREATKDTARCATLEEVFRAGRNKDSWIWWMYPKIKD